MSDTTGTAVTCVGATQLVLKSEVLHGAVASEERHAWVRWWKQSFVTGGGSRLTASAVDDRSTACAMVPL